MREENTITKVIKNIEDFHRENSRAIFLTPKFYLLPYMHNYEVLINIEDAQMKEIVDDSDTLNFDIINIIRLARDAYHSPYENYFTPNYTLIDYQWELCGPKLRNMIRRKAKDNYQGAVGSINNDGGKERVENRSNNSLRLIDPKLKEEFITNEFLDWVSYNVLVYKHQRNENDILSYFRSESVLLYNAPRPIETVANPIVYAKEDSDFVILYTLYGSNSTYHFDSQSLHCHQTRTILPNKIYIARGVETNRFLLFGTVGINEFKPEGWEAVLDNKIRMEKYPMLYEAITDCPTEDTRDIVGLGYKSKGVVIERKSITLKELCRYYSLGKGVKLYPLTRPANSITDQSAVLETNKDTNEFLVFTCWGIVNYRGFVRDVLKIDSKLPVSTMEYGTTYLVYDVESDRAVVFAATIDCIHKSLVDKYLSNEKAAPRMEYFKGILIHLDSEGIPTDGIEVLKQRYKMDFPNIYRLPPNSGPIRDRSVLQYSNSKENLYVYASERATENSNLEILISNKDVVMGSLAFIITGDYLAVDFSKATAVSFKVNYN
jgi:hypothetical protein